MCSANSHPAGTGGWFGGELFGECEPCSEQSGGWAAGSTVPVPKTPYEEGFVQCASHVTAMTPLRHREPVDVRRSFPFRGLQEESKRRRESFGTGGTFIMGVSYKMHTVLRQPRWQDTSPCRYGRRGWRRTCNVVPMPATVEVLHHFVSEGGHSRSSVPHRTNGFGGKRKCCDTR